MEIELPESVVKTLALHSTPWYYSKDRAWQKGDKLELHTEYGMVVLVPVDDDKYLEEVPTTKKVWRSLK